MKEKIKKELEETIVEVIKVVRSSAKELTESCELRENCAAISILVDSLIRLQKEL